MSCRARAEAREKAAAHLAAGNMAAAVECYQRCVDITPAMAKHVIEVGSQFVVFGLSLGCVRVPCLQSW
jgi:hypothetical protein